MQRRDVNTLHLRYSVSVKTSRRFLVGLVMCNGIVSDIVTLILVSTFSFRFKLDVDSLTDTNMNVDCLGYEYK